MSKNIANLLGIFRGGVSIFVPKIIKYEKVYFCINLRGNDACVWLHQG